MKNTVLETNFNFPKQKSLYKGKVRDVYNIDDELLNKARELSGLQEKTALIREGLKALIERESARRLAKLGGSEPQIESIPRRRSEVTE